MPQKHRLYGRPKLINVMENADRNYIIGPMKAPVNYYLFMMSFHILFELMAPQVPQQTNSYTSLSQFEEN